jgi:hypothetical protein
MTISEKLDLLQGKVSESAAAAAAPFATIASGIEDVKSGVAAEMAGEYSRGYADGVASVVNPGDPTRVFTQADLDNAVAGAKAADQVVIDGLNSSIAAMQIEIDGIPAKVALGVASGMDSAKAELLAAYDAAQVAETSVETGFREKLAPSLPVEPSA